MSLTKKELEILEELGKANTFEEKCKIVDKYGLCESLLLAGDLDDFPEEDDKPPTDQAL